MERLLGLKKIKPGAETAISCWFQDEVRNSWKLQSIIYFFSFSVQK
jgi:hypothetical protein